MTDLAEQYYVPDCRFRLHIFRWTLLAIAMDRENRWYLRIGPGSAARGIGLLFRFERL